MITIREVIQDEIPEVKHLLSYVWKDTYSNVYSPEAIEKVTSVWHSPKALSQQVEDENTYFACAKDEKGVIIGLVTARKVKHTLHIGRLYIHPNYQRKGIGSQLMSAAIAYFSDIKTLQLECEKQNEKALSFYQKQGFNIVKEKEENVEGAKVKTVIMERGWKGEEH